MRDRRGQKVRETKEFGQKREQEKGKRERDRVIITPLLISGRKQRQRDSEISVEIEQG